MRTLRFVLLALCAAGRVSADRVIVEFQPMKTGGAAVAERFRGDVTWIQSPAFAIGNAVARRAATLAESTNDAQRKRGGSRHPGCPRTSGKK
jgi:hypothetical protein